MSEPAIRLEEVAVGHERTIVLEGVSGEVRRGTILAVVGANAAGKTTLLRAIAGLARPMRGRIGVRIEESLVDPSSLPPARRATGLAFLPQRLRLPGGFEAREIVEMGRYALPPSAARVEQAIAMLDLAAIADRPIDRLSIGQQQRVALARVLAQHRPGGVVILDEPFASLDLRETARLLGVLRSIAAEGTAVLASVHDLPVAARLADDAWILDGGRLVASGGTDSVLSRASIARIFGESSADLAFGR